jgi:hypothetical protein
MNPVAMSRWIRISTLPAALAFWIAWLGCAPPAEAQGRVRATGTVVFYAAPSGTDAGNTCLSADSPCTAQGALDVAKNNWDFAGQVCFINLANGSYVKLFASGQYVRTHLCHMRGNVDQQSACVDRLSVTVSGFAIEDGMVMSIACLTLKGDGVWGRQGVIVDLADINCEAVPTCVALTVRATANIIREIWISGDATAFVNATQNSYAGFTGQVVVKKRAAVPSFAVATQKSTIQFANPVVNSTAIYGSSGTDSRPQCYRDRTDDIVGSGLPCIMNTTYGD